MLDRSTLRSESLVGVVMAAPPCVRVAPDGETSAEFLHDESKLAAIGVASLALPETLTALREVVSWHAHERHAVAVSGSRTGVAGGAVPEEGSHLVSLSALRGVCEVDLSQMSPTATVLAGTWLSELNAHLARQHPGLVFPVDPTETSASLGGMVATNAGGARSFRFGATRPWVEALTIELPSARTLHLRRGRERVEHGVLSLDDGGELRHLRVSPIPKPATKNAIGYGLEEDGDALDLWIGSEGTLGIVSEVTVRLEWQRESRLGYLQFFDRVVDAFAFVATLRGDATLRTTAVEFLDARSHQLARESGKPAVERVLQMAGEGSVSVFVEIGYDGDDALSRIAARLLEMVEEAGGNPEASVAGASEDELRDIRALRHAVPERVNAMIAQRRQRHPSLHKIATDMAVPDTELTWVFQRYSEVFGGAGLDFAAFGHVGNNHFHVNILPRDPSELARAKECYAVLAAEVVARRGSIAAEHGIGRIKKGLLPLQYGADTMADLRAVKRWIDPLWRLNRGVLIDP